MGRGSSWWDLVLGSERLPSFLSSLSAHSSVLSGGLPASVHLHVCMSGVCLYVHEVCLSVGMCQGAVCVHSLCRNRQNIWLLMALCGWLSVCRAGARHVCACVFVEVGTM